MKREEGRHEIELRRAVPGIAVREPTRDELEVVQDTERKDEVRQRAARDIVGREIWRGARDSRQRRRKKYGQHVIPCFV